MIRFIEAAYAAVPQQAKPVIDAAAIAGRGAPNDVFGPLYAWA